MLPLHEHVFIQQVHVLRCSIMPVFCVLIAILSELLQRENRVLHFWTQKKKRLDQCQQYVLFERHVKQVRRRFVQNEGTLVVLIVASMCNCTKSTKPVWKIWKYHFHHMTDKIHNI